MTDYRVYLLNEADHICDWYPVRADSDDAAIDAMARLGILGPAAELWSGRRKITHLTAEELDSRAATCALVLTTDQEIEARRALRLYKDNVTALEPVIDTDPVMTNRLMATGRAALARSRNLLGRAKPVQLMNVVEMHGPAGLG